MTTRVAGGLVVVGAVFLCVWIAVQGLSSSDGSEVIAEREYSPEQAANLARRAILDAQKFSIEGKTAEAIKTLRGPALAGVRDVDLFVTLAQTLLAGGEGAPAGRVEEAQRWAERACDLTGYTDATAMATLAAAYRAVGETDRADRTLHKAKELARRSQSSR